MWFVLQTKFEMDTDQFQKTIASLESRLATKDAQIKVMRTVLEQIALFMMDGNLKIIPSPSDEACLARNALASLDALEGK
jgi:hypothetical protein